MKKHFVDNHASCDKGSDVIQHLKIDLERLSEVIIKSYFISELQEFSFCILVWEKFLDKTFLSFEHILVQFVLKLNKSKI